MNAPTGLVTESVAKRLYELFGTALYGHDIGPWESDRVQDERNRWLAHADALLASDALAQMLAEARAEGVAALLAEAEYRQFPAPPQVALRKDNGYVSMTTLRLCAAALAAAEPDAGERS